VALAHIARFEKQLLTESVKNS